MKSHLFWGDHADCTGNFAATVSPPISLPRVAFETIKTWSGFLGLVTPSPWSPHCWIRRTLPVAQFPSQTSIDTTSLPHTMSITDGSLPAVHYLLATMPPLQLPVEAIVVAFADLGAAAFTPWSASLPYLPEPPPQAKQGSATTVSPLISHVTKEFANSPPAATTIKCVAECPDLQALGHSVSSCADAFFSREIFQKRRDGRWVCACDIEMNHPWWSNLWIFI